MMKYGGITPRSQKGMDIPEKIRELKVLLLKTDCVCKARKGNAKCIASLPEFGAYANTHGATYEEALRNAQEVLSLLVAR